MILGIYCSIISLHVEWFFETKKQGSSHHLLSERQSFVTFFVLILLIFRHGRWSVPNLFDMGGLLTSAIARLPIRTLCPWRWRAFNAVELSVLLYTIGFRSPAFAFAVWLSKNSSTKPSSLSFPFSKLWLQLQLIRRHLLLDQCMPNNFLYAYHLLDAFSRLQLSISRFHPPGYVYGLLAPRRPSKSH